MALTVDAEITARPQAASGAVPWPQGDGRRTGRRLVPPSASVAAPATDGRGTRPPVDTEMTCSFERDPHRACPLGTRVDVAPAW